LAIFGTVLFLFTLIILEWLEARLGFGGPVNRLQVHLHDNHRAVGKALDALNRLGAQVKQATVLPGAGSSALLQVELARAISAEQAPLLAKQLLTLKKYVAQVDTAITPLDEPGSSEEPSEHDDEPVVPLNLSDATLLRDMNEQDDGGHDPAAPHTRAAQKKEAKQ
jgi:putative Mg2+ transporter-C (MgtC) family protein